MGLEPFYQSDEVTVYCGDCRLILPELTIGKNDLICADPPYGIKLETDYSSRSNLWESYTYAPVHGDDAPFDPAHLLAYRNLILWGANYYADKLPAQGQWLIWDKRDGIPSNNQADAELAWTRGTTGTTPRIFRHMWNGFSRASESGNKGANARVHPTQKPTALMQWCISKFFPKVDTVIDPYMGSGTTLQAARMEHKRAIGIEISEAYCAIAVNRLSTTPVLEEWT